VSDWPGPLVLAVAGMAVVTYALRFLPLAFLARVTMHPRVLQFLEYFPVAVLSAFVVPLVLAPEGRLWLSLQNEALLAGLLTLPVAVLSRSLIVTVIAGSVIMALIRVFA